MVEFLIDNIFVKFGGCLFRQVIGIPMGTNCAPLLADLFLYSYESEFLDNMIRGGHKLQLHNAIYRLRFFSNSLTHILSLSNSHIDIASIQENRADKSHSVIVAIGNLPGHSIYVTDT